MKPFILIFFFIQLLTAGPTGTSVSETSVRLTGRLDTVWADWGDGQSARFFYLVEPDGKRTRLLVDESIIRRQPDTSQVSSPVTVEGFWREDAAGRMLATTDIEVGASANSPAAHTGSDGSPSAVVSGSRPWLIILCKFSDLSDEPRSVSDYQSLLSSSYPGMDHFWREVSYDQMNLAGSRVIGWYTLPSPRSRYLYGSLPMFDTNASFGDAIRLADPYVNFSSYSGITLVFNDFLGPATMAYGGSVTATLDGVRRTWGVTWMPVFLRKPVYDHQVESTHRTFAHEMGHAFGLPHSSSSYGETYDSYWDLMSHWDGRVVTAGFGLQGQHTISYHKDMLGWIGSGKRFAPSGTQSTVELEHLSLPRSSRLKMVQIPVSGSDRFYTAESRSRVGYDEALFGKAVILHEVIPGRYQTNVVTGGNEWRPAHVIDADANEYTNDGGVMWTPGETFRDETNGIAISVDEETAQGFVLTVNHNLHILPQFVVGGGIASTLILSNPSAASPVSGSIRMTRSDGHPLSARINGSPGEDSVDFEIAQGGLAFFAMESEGELAIGWAEVSADRPVNASLVYTGLGGVAGVASSTLSTRSLLAPVESNVPGGIRSGLALSNPQASEVQVNFWLRGVDGLRIPAGDRSLTLGPREQVAQFADELFTPIDLSRFRGTVEVESSLPINGVAIRTSPNQFATLPIQAKDKVSRPRQTGVVATFAGLAGSSGLINGSANDARFNYPQGLARDVEGNIYIADTANHAIRRIASGSGLVSTFAGSGAGGSADGVGQAASFLYPRGLFLDKSANLWVADTDNHTIRKIAPDGTVTTVAGKAGEAGSADGPGLDARFRGPRGIAVTDSGEVYVADRANHVIRRITAAGEVTTLAGSAGQAGFADGTGSAARFDAPAKLALAPDGNLYVTDVNNCVIRRVTPLGEVTTFAGVAGVHGTRDGPALDALFSNPRGISADASGALYVSDGWTVRKISPNGFVTTLAGNMKILSAPGMTGGGSVDGVGIAARFAVPWDVIPGPGGALYVADTNNHTLRRIAVADLTEKLYFPQFGDGQGLSSCLIVVNPSTTEDSSGTVEFRDAAGNPLAVDINGEPPRSSVDFNCPPGGVSFLETDGLGDLCVGSAMITSTVPVSATVLFSSPWGLTGVPSMRPSVRFGIPVDIASTRKTNTGLALSNPNDSAAQVTVRLKDQNGGFITGAYSQFEIPARGQLARFPAEVFQGMPAMGDFRGMFVVESTQPICGMGVLTTVNEAAALPTVALR